MLRLVPDTIVLIAAGLALTACAPTPVPGTAGPAHRPASFVRSGDHMVVNGQTVVLADAETPQAAGMAKCRAEARAAERSAERVRVLLADARDIAVQRVAQGDSALVHLDGLDLGLTLISEGLAVRRGAAPMDWCAAIPSWRAAEIHPALVAGV